VAGHVGSDLGDDADDLVAGDDGEGLGPPVAVDGVDVGVADAGVLDLDEDVVRADVPPLDGGGSEGLAGGGGGVGVDVHGRGLLGLVGQGRPATAAIALVSTERLLPRTWEVGSVGGRSSTSLDRRADVASTAWTTAPTSATSSPAGVPGSPRSRQVCCRAVDGGGSPDCAARRWPSSPG
jgi:hypothetical protein